MLSVQELNKLCQESIEAVNGLKKHFLIISESHLAKRLRVLKEYESPILVALLPSASGSSPNVDTLSWQNELMFMVLKGPINYTKRTLEQEVEDFQQTQELTREFLDYLRQRQLGADACHFLKKLDLNSLQVDPEYNMHACDGWSLSLNIKTT